jgi:predicted chitinase
MNRTTFFNLIRTKALLPKMSQEQVDSINAILDEIERQNVTDNKHKAYIMATAFHETAHTMLPVVEYGSQKYLRSKNYYPYIGRGFVQLTWLYNYEKYSKIMGIDFVSNPELLLDVKNSAFILVHGMKNGTFTGKKLSDYKGFISMRKIINGNDRAFDIAVIADLFLIAFSA